LRSARKRNNTGGRLIKRKSEEEQIDVTASLRISQIESSSTGLVNNIAEIGMRFKGIESRVHDLEVFVSIGSLYDP
jgi:hypothetical protein